MICPTCRNTITGLACVNCSQKRAFEHALANQANHIPHVLTRSMQLRLWRQTRHHGAVHIGLFNYEKVSFCGADLRDHSYSRFEEWDEEDIAAQTCSKCFEIFSKFVAECHAAAARTE